MRKLLLAPALLLPLLAPQPAAACLAPPLPVYPGAIVSQSFGLQESAIKGGGNNTQVQQAHENYELFQSLGDTIIASAGDFGASNGVGVNSPQYPASDPLITSVGGTEGNPYPLGLCPSANQAEANADVCHYGGEQTWNEPDIANVRCE